MNIEAFDKVVDAATKTGMKLIVALTNNWADYGGMDVYTVNLGGQYHDDVCLPNNACSFPPRSTSLPAYRLVAC